FFVGLRFREIQRTQNRRRNFRLPSAYASEKRAGAGFKTSLLRFWRKRPFRISFRATAFGLPKRRADRPAGQNHCPPSGGQARVFKRFSKSRTLGNALENAFIGRNCQDSVRAFANSENRTKRFTKSSQRAIGECSGLC